MVFGFVCDVGFRGIQGNNKLYQPEPENRRNHCCFSYRSRRSVIRESSSSISDAKCAQPLGELHVVRTFVGDVCLERTQVGNNRFEQWLVTDLISNEVQVKAQIQESDEYTASVSLDTAENWNLSEVQVAVFVVLIQACCHALGFTEVIAQFDTDAVLQVLQMQNANSDSVPELSDVVADNGNSLIVLPRSVVTQNRVLHRCVAVLCVDRVSRKILLVKRAPRDSRVSSGGKWDLFVAGGVQSGEEDTFCAIRELNEELGMQNARVRKIDRCLVRSEEVNSVVEVFLALGEFEKVVEDENKSVNVNEITEVELVSKVDLKKRMEENPELFVHEAVMVWKRLTQLESDGSIRLDK